MISPGMHSMRFLLLCALTCVMVCSCEEQKEHTAPAINPADSVAMMTSYGINTLVSDSGVMKYRIIAERWEVNEALNPPRWIFRRGLFLQQFDETFHTETYIQCDTAYYFTVNKLWHLMGNVRVRTTDGLRFSSEELFWDQNKHELYSNKFSHLVTPERELQGTYFTSDERMTHYKVTNTKGSFQSEDALGKKDDKKTDNKDKADSTASPKRAPAQPQPKK